jgi:hypothetical protein
MVKIKRLEVRGFRGVLKPATLDFGTKCQSMIVVGGNGKGKSSFADALELFVTGDIHDLRREGCGPAAYRHRRLPPTEDACIDLRLSEGGLSSTLSMSDTLTRSHSNDAPDFESYLKDSADELLFLRYKELTRFVDYTKGDKRKQVASLIGLDKLEEVRDDLGWVTTQLRSDLREQERALRERQEEVKDIIDAPFKWDDVWRFAGQQAGLLDIAAPSSLEDLRATAEAAGRAVGSLQESAALQALEQAIEVLSRAEKAPDPTASAATYAATFNAICSDPPRLLALNLRKLYEQGLAVIEQGLWGLDACPLCDAQIPLDSLRQHIVRHLEMADAATKDREKLSDQRDSFAEAALALREALGAVSDLDEKQNPGLSPVKGPAAAAMLELASLQTKAEADITPGKSIDLSGVDLGPKLATLRETVASAVEWANQEQKRLALSDADLARVKAAQRLETLRNRVEALQRRSAQRDNVKGIVDSMSTVVSAFQDLRRDLMGKVLTTISGDVSSYFTKLHPNDGFDEVELRFLPEEDGVEFRLLYHGEEITPPRKLLSESHLNSLGICLFLATARTFNKRNGFLVLDDVINSFDADHRAELASLLVNEFSDTQLLVFTHDRTWFRYLRDMSKNWKYMRIADWTYEDGLTLATQPDEELAEVEEEIRRGIVGNAANSLRRYTEGRLKFLCESVGAYVRFRRDERNDERYVPELVSALKIRLKAGKSALVDDANLRDLEASAFVMNQASHDRTASYADLDMPDVRFALDRLLKVEALFRCTGCDQLMWKVCDPHLSQMNCDCGNLSLR